MEKEENETEVFYDDEIDALYLKLGDEKPEGVVEVSEGVSLDTTSEGRLVGIEILDASNKVAIETILSYTLELNKRGRFTFIVFHMIPFGQGDIIYRIQPPNPLF
ncbi:MAG: DUF2283 domain-containing protein [Candidatus Desantisbacteria bacterium]